MKNEYRSMMNNLTLSPASRSTIEAQISSAPESTKGHAQTFRRIAITAACVLVLVAFVGFPLVTQATDKLQEVMSWLTDHSELKSLEVAYQPTDSGVAFLIGKDKSGYTFEGSYYDGTIPSWLTQEDEHLFFTANGEHMDITEQFTMDTPFTYIYTDEQMIIHYIAVGGEYDGDLSYHLFGYAEWFQVTPGAESIEVLDEDGWMGGYSGNAYSGGTSEYPWFTAAKEIFDLPWYYR